MWLYVPSESCHSVPGEVPSTSLSGSQVDALARSAWSRGKPMRPAYWSKTWKQGGWIRRLSTLTSEPSTLAPGVERWIASWRGSPASPTAPPASGPAIPTSEHGATTTDPCFTPPGSSRSVVPPWCSSRTFLPGLLEDTSEASDQSYADWVTRSKARSSSVRRMLARHINASESSSSAIWPTPNAQEATGYMSGSNRDTWRPTLSGAVQGKTAVLHQGRPSPEESGMWPTPNVPNGGRTMSEEDVTAKGATENGKRQVSLEMVTRMWPTATVNGNHNRAGLSEKSGDGLATAASAWPTPRVTTSGSIASQKQMERIRSGEETLSGVGKLELTAEMWATPATRDHRSGLASQETLERNARPLNEQMESMWGTPLAWAGSKPSAGNRISTDLSHQAQAIHPGEPSSRKPRGLRPQLNAFFVCWLMGLPFLWTHPEWTNSDAEETESWLIRRRVRLRSLLDE